MTRFIRMPRLAALGIFVLALALAACGGAAAPTKPPAATAGKAATFLGSVPGTDAFIGLTNAGDGTSLSYVCDSKQIATWFSGPVTNNAVDLTAANGDKLKATFAATGATGTVTVAGKDYPFTAAPRSGDGGLFRAEGNANGTSTIAGWIVMADGQQRGADADRGAAGNVVSAAPVLNVKQQTSPNVWTVTHPVVGPLTVKRVNTEREDGK